MIRNFLLAIVFCFPLSVLAQQQRGPFVKYDLFTADREQIFDGGTLTYRMAVDADEIIAVNSCNAPYVYFFNSKGIKVDECKLPYEGCLRNM